VDRLCEEWRQGVNRFQREGEAFYLGRSEGHILGVGGVNLDPYCNSREIGRVRRLYVVAEYRRRGVGRTLVERAIQEARRSFRELRVRAGSADAAAFFVALGFEAIRDPADATHRLLLR
jgi:GNAT superfamily N-acetyltransferase